MNELETIMTSNSRDRIEVVEAGSKHTSPHNISLDWSVNIPKLFKPHQLFTREKTCKSVFREKFQFALRSSHALRLIGKKRVKP